MDYTYNRNAASNEGVEWIQSEVIGQPVGMRGGRLMEDAINEYVRLLLLKSQEMHQLFNKQMEMAKQMYSDGENITGRDIELALLRGVVGDRLGDDALAKVVAKVIAHGEYVF
jgi:hypothetical protein